MQNQRGALILLGGKVFIPGGHIGDCLGYHGWIVGITTSGTPQVSAWATTALPAASGIERYRLRWNVAGRHHR